LPIKFIEPLFLLCGGANAPPTISSMSLSFQISVNLNFQTKVQKFSEKRDQLTPTEVNPTEEI